MYFVDNKNYNGKLVLFLHGVGSSSRMWSEHISKMVDYRCVAVDLPGHGNSNSQKWISLDDTSDQIHDLVKGLTSAKICLVGLSLGGSIIINFLAKYGDMVESAVIDGAGIFPIKHKKLVESGVKIISPFIKFELLTKMLSKSIGVSDANYNNFRKDIISVNKNAFSKAFCDANDQSEPANFDKIQTRTLFVAGEREPDAVKLSNNYLANKISNGESYLMPNEGHGWLAKNSEVHVEMVLSWLEYKFLPKQLIKN